LHKELKEHLLKQVINLCMRVIDKIVPEPRARYPQTKMVKHVFQQLFNAYCLEVWGGRFDDVPHQTLKGLQDKNFLHFLSATRKILLYVGENDRYYRAWIGLAFIAAKEEYGRALMRLTQEEFRSSHLEMWEWTPLPLCDSYFEGNKSEFLEMMLTGHLSNLLRLRFASSKSPQSKKKIGG
jgi:hypothetical protein